MSESEGRFEVSGEFAFIGRTFSEYLDMFDLDPAALRGRVLDCPAGPGSFPAVAAGLGADVTAVDPLDGRPTDSLERECTAAVERAIDQLREKRDLFVWDYYGDVATRGRYLRAAAERFLADYARRPGRYVHGALPALPFRSDAFELVLSANFLFLYDDRLGEAFHRAALRELARVAAGEVRVFPLAALDREPSVFLHPAIDALRDDGLEVARVEVPYEFQPGATRMLVVSDVAGYRPPAGR